MLRRVHIALVFGCLVAGCTTSPDTGDVVAAQPGAYQPAGNGKAVSENDACTTLVNAVDKKWQGLGCGAVSHAACPDYIRPAGGQACLQYDDGSVNACVDFVGKYTSCDDFKNHPCIVTALVGTAPQGCPGGSGAGGAGGTAGAGGAAGGGGVGGAGASDAGL